MTFSLVLDIVLAVALFIIVVKFVSNVKRVTIFEYERGVKYVKGRFAEILEPGQYWFFTYHTSITKTDLRPRFVSISGQEVLSSDGVTLKVSLAAKYEISDPYAAMNKIDDYSQALYLELQLALRQIIGSTAIDELLKKRQTVGEKLMELAASSLEEFGLKLLSVNVKDIMFPGELKKMFAQVVQAQKEGRAALEKARAEDAALRKLANSAKLLGSNPNLLQLRLLESLETSSGNTIMLEMPPITITPAQEENNGKSKEKPKEKSTAPKPSRRRKKPQPPQQASS